jgi:hypothetical protein
MVQKRRNVLSKLSTGQLQKRRARLARSVPPLETVLQGALIIQRRRCGKPGCRCARGELHGPYVFLTVRRRTGRRLLYVPAALAAVVRRRVSLTARIAATLAEISAINLELLTRGALT